jgi:Ca2+-binding RTX toxin-like protein
MQIDLDNAADDGRNCPATCENDNVRDTNEVVNGDTSADVIVGNSSANTLAGDSGDDTLSGGQGTGADGADNFDGEAGTGDLVTYSPPVGSARTGNLTVTINETGSAAGNADGDDLDTIEDLTGGDGADTLTGDGDVNTVSGGPGTASDTVNGGNNNDVLQGGTGTNTAPDGADNLNGQGGTGDAVSYASRTASVVVDLDDVADDGNGGCPSAGTCEDDNVASTVENLTGGNGGDTLTGNGVANVLNGGPASDFLSGGTSGAADGADTFIGGTNNSIGDLVTYAPTGGTARTGAITADADGAAGDDTDGDTVGADIENLTGGGGSDNLTGNDNANVMRGGPGTGNDTLAGLGEDDGFFGGTGLNTGPDGADSFNAGAQGDDGDTVSYDNRDDDISATIGGAADSDGDNVQSAIDNLVGGDGNDNLTGDADPNQLTGGAANDILAGGAGTAADSADRFLGGSGTDEVSYLSRDDDIGADLDGVADDGNIPGAEDDEIESDVEDLTGGDGDDGLSGDGDANVLDGRGGDDNLRSGDAAGPDGVDTFIGGTNGTPGGANGANGDRAFYSSRLDDLVVDIGGGPDAPEGDTVRDDIENLSTGDGDDTLTGDNDNNALFASEGSNTMRGGTGATGDGDDLFQGGGGENVVTYSHRTDDLTINQSVANSGPEGDSYSGTSIDAIVGGSGDDTMTGSSGGNTLEGGPGEDDLFGLAGADTLNARDGGPDSLDCGPDADVAEIDSTTLDTVAPATCENVDDLPDTAITAKPRNRTTRRRARFEFNSPTGATEFECSLDGASFAACTSPQVYTGLSRRRHTFKVRAIDADADADISPAIDKWKVLRR